MRGIEVLPDGMEGNGVPPAIGVLTAGTDTGVGWRMALSVAMTDGTRGGAAACGATAAAPVSVLSMRGGGAGIACRVTSTASFALVADEDGSEFTPSAGRTDAPAPAVAPLPATEVDDLSPPLATAAAATAFCVPVTMLPSARATRCLRTARAATCASVSRALPSASRARKAVCSASRSRSRSSSKAYHLSKPSEEAAAPLPPRPPTSPCNVVPYMLRGSKSYIMRRYASLSASYASLMRCTTRGKASVKWRV